MPNAGLLAIVCWATKPSFPKWCHEPIPSWVDEGKHLSLNPGNKSLTSQGFEPMSRVAPAERACHLTTVKNNKTTP